MTAATQTLSAWLLAQIAEDEVKAREAIALAEPFKDDDVHYVWARLLGRGPGRGSHSFVPGAPSPARVLAECEAKRRIVARHTSCDDTSFGEPCDDLRDLTAPYADREGYRPEWRS